MKKKEGINNRVPTAQGKQGTWPKEFPVRENREFGSFAKTGNLVCSSCKFPDSKGKIYIYFFLVEVG